jgi:retron-type reverse transcriptase
MQTEDMCNAVIPIEDIFAAYYECRRHKRKRHGALRFEVDLEKELVDLWREINAGTWRPRPSRVFVVNKPVTREIFAAAFRDRIVHHLVIGRLNPLFEKYFIYDAYSCRTGKGTHFGIHRAEKFMRRCSRNSTRPAWVLKIDIRGYFMSINRDILYRKLAAFIDERYTAAGKNLIKELCRLIIYNDPAKNCERRSPPEAWNNLPPDKSLFSAKKGCGLPIGNLGSQIFANFYLTDFDHFIKKHCGIAFYGRYVDDCIIVHRSRAFLKRFVPVLRRYLAENLRLTLHPQKIYLQPCVHGVRFLGCFIKPSHTVVHHRTLRNFRDSVAAYTAIAAGHKPDKNELAAFISSINSYLGILKHYKTYRKRRDILNKNLSANWYRHIAPGPGYAKVLVRKQKAKL